MIGKRWPVRARCKLSWIVRSARHRQPRHRRRAARLRHPFPPPGDSDVISQIDRLSSNEDENRAEIGDGLAVGVWGSVSHNLHGRLQSATGGRQPHTGGASVAIHSP